MEKFGGYKKHESKEEISLGIKLVEGLINRYSEHQAVDETLGETYAVESDLFTVSFTVSDTEIGIRNIESFEAGARIGSDVLDYFHQIADEYDLEVRAHKVLGTAVAYWEDQGYEIESGDSDDDRVYVRVG